MLVSALLTSVLINSSFSVLFWTLYSSLRKHPTNYGVFAPRLIAEAKSGSRDAFHLLRLLPTPGWVARALQTSEADLLSSAGLDAVVFRRLITFSLRVITLAGVIGVFILLPVNFSGDQLKDLDFANLTSSSLDIFTISNVKDGSQRLWVHFGAVYVLTIFTCFLLYNEYKYISSKRISYFLTSKPQASQYTILVRGVPVSHFGSVSDCVERFFREYHPDTYLSHVVIRRKSKVRHLSWEVRAAFVSFKTRYGAAVAIRMQQANDPTHWVTEAAPEPHDVYWPFFSESFIRRWISQLAVLLAYVIITLSFLIPVVLVQGLTNLSQLEAWFPAIKNILEVSFIHQVVTGYLPNLILLLFLSMIPYIMKVLSSAQGHISKSEIIRSACNKYFWFTIWNVYFGNVLSGSVFNHIFTFLEPTNVPSQLAVAVPAQASFFIAYVVTSGWTSTSIELFRLFPLILSIVRRPFKKAVDVKVRSFRYHAVLPRVLFFGLLGITYFFLAPLILPFLFVYFCLGYIVYTNQFINVYSPKHDTAGKFWPLVHDAVIFSLLLMHAIAIGIFTLKKLSLASSLLFPLPVLTLIFNSYCRKRFLPIFRAYSTETLIEKDRKDLNDATTAAFFDKLSTAYEDPALLPVQYSAVLDDENTPLLYSTTEIEADRISL